jgi:peptide/nickel transport system substrate-binding protein
LNRHDPGRAKPLLDEAGYRYIDGDGFWENPDGTALKFEIQVVNGWSDWVQAV